jgi:hypothetical protein
MATDALVDVSYRGLVLGKRLRLLQVGPRSAYVACDVPMPVGTELVLAVDETVIIPAQVARVREADSKDGPTGMWLWTDAAEARAQAWWDAHVSAPDPHIPEPAGGRIRTEGPVAPPPEVSAEAAPAPAAAAPVAAGAAQAPADTSAPAPAAPVAPAAEPVAALAAEASAGHESIAAEEPAAGRESVAAEEPATGYESSAAEEPLAGHEGAAAEEPAAGIPGHGAPDDAIAAAASDVAEPLPETALDAEEREDDGYAVEIAAGDAGDAGDAGEDAGEELADVDAPASGRARRARGTEVMTAVELAEILGTTPEAAAEAAAATSEDGAAEDGEILDRPREIRRTQVMSAVEVDELLQVAGTEDPIKPEATPKGKNRNKRRRRR